MDRLNEGVDQFDTTVKGWLSALDQNQYLSSIIILILIVYAGLAAPRLPDSVLRFFDNTLVKLILLFLIAYIATKNPTVAIVAAIALIVTLQILNYHKVNRMFVSMMHKQEMARAETMNSYGAETMNANNGAASEENTSMMGAGSEEASDMAQAGDSCTVTANFRNNFYPQYVNMKPDAYMARYSGQPVGGFDPNSWYAKEDKY